MKHTEAADAFLELQPQADQLDPMLKRLEQAKRVLKGWMQEQGKTTYRGITLSETRSLRLDTQLARAALGPRKVEECTVETSRFSLLLPAKLRRQKAPEPTD